MSRKDSKNRKRHWGGVIATILEIVVPIVVMLVTFLVPALQGDDKMDARLSLIGLGIVTPIVILQWSVNSREDKNERDIEDLSVQVDQLDDKLQHISPMLEQVFISGDERLKRFVFHRAKEMYRVIQAALNNKSSGILSVSEYYEELEYLAQLIISDKNNHPQKKDFHGEVWAMTSFAVEEWSDEGYEKAWTDKLREMVDKGIPTKRLCIIPKELQDVISTTPFAEPSEKKHPYFSFMSLLQDYYGKDATHNIATHYCIKEGDVPELTQQRGFFAIKLTNSDLHILTGETVNSVGALTAQVLFDQGQIREIRTLFDRHCRNNTQIDKAIAEIDKSGEFLKYLQNNDINLTTQDEQIANNSNRRERVSK